MNYLKNNTKFLMICVGILAAIVTIFYSGTAENTDPKGDAELDIVNVVEPAEVAPKPTPQDVPAVQADDTTELQQQTEAIVEVDPIENTIADNLPVVAAPEINGAGHGSGDLVGLAQPDIETDANQNAANLRASQNIDPMPEVSTIPAVSAERAPETGLAPESQTPEIVTDAVIEPTQSADPLPVLSATTLTLQTARPADAAPNLDAITPRFDLVRVDPNGTTLVAGQAEPNVTVTIISDGEILAETQTSASGEFVAFLTAPIAQPQPIEISDDLKQPNQVITQAQVVILPNQDNPETAPMVVLATQDKVEVIQPSGLSIPDNVSLDSISYDVDGNVVLAGRGAQGRMARIYADGVFQGAAAIGNSGSWDVSLNGLEAGRYVLRVDEVLPDDSVSSRVESPFQREFPEALALSGFAQGAKVIVQPGNTLWLMATQAYGDGDYYTQIFSANSGAIRDPDLIYPGQVFSIPEVAE